MTGLGHVTIRNSLLLLAFWFSATVIAGDATSGTDLTPGVVKTFTIEVQ